MEKLVHRISLLTALCIVIMLAPAYAATVTTFTDSSQFALMSADMTAVDFSSNPCLSGIGSVCPGNTGAGFFFGSAENQVQFTGINADGSSLTYLKWGTAPLPEAYVTTRIYTSEATRQLRINLPNGGATAIALNLMTLLTLDWGDTYSSGGDITITLPAGTVGPITTLAWKTSDGGSPTAKWLGITSDMPITTLSLSSSQGGLAVNGLWFGTATIADPAPETPEISTMLMIGFGLVSIKAAKKFRRTEA